MLADWRAYWGSLQAVVYGSDAATLLRSAPQPVTIIHGARDWVAPAPPVRRLAAEHATLTYREIAAAGHNPCYTHPAAFYEALGV